MTLDERKIKNETNQIPRNPQGINGLWLVSSTAGGPAQRNLSDRSAGMRGDIDRSTGAPEEQPKGDSELSEQRGNPGAELPERENDQTKPISRNFI